MAQGSKPTIKSHKPLPPSKQQSVPPPLTPKGKSSGRKNWKERGCYSKEEFSELTSDIISLVHETEVICEGSSSQPLAKALNDLCDMVQVLLESATDMADKVSSGVSLRRSCTVLREKLAALLDLSSVLLSAGCPNPAQRRVLDQCLFTISNKCEEIMNVVSKG